MTPAQLARRRLELGSLSHDLLVALYLRGVPRVTYLVDEVIVDVIIWRDQPGYRSGRGARAARREFEVLP